MKNQYNGMPKDRWLVQESLQKVSLGPEKFMAWVEENHDQFDTPFFNLLRKMREYTEKHEKDSPLAKTFQFLESCFQKIFDLDGEYGSIVITEDSYKEYWQKASNFIATDKAHHAINILEALKVFFIQNSKSYQYQEAVHSNLGTAYAQMHQYQKAINNFEKALTLGEVNQVTKAKIFSNLAMAYNSIKNHEKAIEYQQKALEISQTQNRKDLEVKHLNNLAILHMDNQNISEALTVQTQALETAKKTGSEKIIADSLTRMGVLHAFTGELEKSQQACSEALKMKDPFAGNE